MKAALVILSGGQDSTTALHWAKHQFDHVAAITFDYGQTHSRELEAARLIATMAGVPHEFVTMGRILKSTSPLTDPSRELETYTDYESMVATIGDRVELTFVPMRNALFLTLAANRAVALNMHHLVIGVCQQDTGNYPDTTAEFIEDMEAAIDSALGNFDITIHTPLMDLTKAETVKLAASLPGCMEALAYSHTAYDGGYPPNGKDHASVLRAKGFEQANVADPLVVRAWREGLMDLPGTANYDSLRKPG